MVPGGYSEAKPKPHLQLWLQGPLSVACLRQGGGEEGRGEEGEREEEKEPTYCGD